jgi:hypothetical protein
MIIPRVTIDTIPAGCLKNAMHKNSMFAKRALKLKFNNNTCNLSIINIILV